MFKLEAAKRLTATTKVSAAVTSAQKAQLKKAGYKVEKLSESDWAGMYRWENDKTDDFQDNDPCDTEADAWQDAWGHFQNK